MNIGQKQLNETSTPKKGCLDSDARYLGLTDLSQRLSLSPRTIRSYINDPDNPLPAYKFGNKFTFFWPEIQAWARTHKYKPIDTDSIVNGIMDEFRKE